MIAAATRLRRAHARTNAGLWELRIGGALVAVLLGLLVLRGVLPIPDPLAANLVDRFQPFGTPGHVFGTDQNGRDLAARAVAGLRWSIGCAALATLFAATIGTVLGLLAAMVGGWTQRIVDHGVAAMMAFPAIVAAVVILAVAGSGFMPLVLTITLLGWAVFARVVQAEATALMARPYVLAAQLAGASRLAIALGHVLPGIAPTLLVMVAFFFGDALITESALTFLGLGAPFDAPTWGNMLQEGRLRMLQAPWLMLVPAGCIIVTVLAANLLGDGIAAWTRRDRHSFAA
ncbi:ABC transporter permease [Roseiterribacter gracilis]|uniref:ABC transmembrane type-1 domain-containing protein n=1 Tax=Roseiterribacter gracilis TaxID=2812848 RepID=A0A8S8X8V8_9PROT|nr:hypothetical protein TMPK1_07090 [Rhodospirillales bacterium TMPK1]